MIGDKSKNFYNLSNFDPILTLNNLQTRKTGSVSLIHVDAFYIVHHIIVIFYYHLLVSYIEDIKYCGSIKY